MSVKKNEKVNFLRWINENHSFKNYSCKWLINSLCLDEDRLEDVYFVERALGFEQSMIISTEGTDTISFRLIAKNRLTSDVEKGIQWLQEHKKGPLYIEINFPGKYHENKFLNVLTDSPFEKKTTFTGKEKERVDQEINSLLLYIQIDEALQNKDKDKFTQLVHHAKKNARV